MVGLTRMTTLTIMMFKECRRHIKTSYLRTDLIVNSEKFASVPKVTSASSVNLYSLPPQTPFIYPPLDLPLQTLVKSPPLQAP